MKFKAAILEKTGQPLLVDDVECLPLQAHDVLVRLQASGLCHTDYEVIQGSLPYPLPIILGHEGAGIVEEIGPSVKSVKVGDKVICSWNPFCGHCFYCVRNQPILCEPFSRNQPSGHLMDGTSRYLWRGEKMHHFSVVSSHAQFTVVPESGAIVVPAEIPSDRACLIGCGVMTGVGAVLRHAKVQAGSHVLVIGCGAVGLNVIQGARIADAQSIIAIDRNILRDELSSQMGATHCLHGSAEELRDQVFSLTQGRGADYVFECVGQEATLRLALEALRPGGQLVILGKTEVNRNVSLRFGSLMGDKRIVRSSYGGARPIRDFPWLAQAYLNGSLKLDELISMRLPLKDINIGFDALAQGNIVRAVIQM